MPDIKLIKRDANGLIEGIEYKFNDSGLIDWKSMVSKEFLYVNPDQKRRKKIEEKYNKPYEEIDPLEDKVDDQDLVIMLGGLKQLLKLRGFTRVYPEPFESNENYASVNCIIDFIGNYETENQPISYSENACAHAGNTNNFAKNYLLEIATNRALARCIRNFLNINIVSKEEIQGSSFEEEQPTKSSLDPVHMLSKLLKDKNLNFEDIIKGIKDIENCKSINDLNKAQIFSLIGKIKLSNKV